MPFLAKSLEAFTISERLSTFSAWLDAGRLGRELSTRFDADTAERLSLPLIEVSGHRLLALRAGEASRVPFLVECIDPLLIQDGLGAATADFGRRRAKAILADDTSRFVLFETTREEGLALDAIEA